MRKAGFYTLPAEKDVVGERYAIYVSGEDY